MTSFQEFGNNIVWINFPSYQIKWKQKQWIWLLLKMLKKEKHMVHDIPDPSDMQLESDEIWIMNLN